MDSDAKTITVSVDLKAGALLPCPECWRQRCAVKDRRQRTWRHLDTCQYKTIVQGPLPRTECPECGVKTVEPPWAVRYSRFTKGFEHLAIQCLQEMSMSGACRILRLTWDEVDGIMERAVRRGLQRRDLSGLRRIGIDEKAVRRGLATSPSSTT